MGQRRFHVCGRLNGLVEFGVCDRNNSLFAWFGEIHGFHASLTLLSLKTGEFFRGFEAFNNSAWDGDRR